MAEHWEVKRNKNNANSNYLIPNINKKKRHNVRNPSESHNNINLNAKNNNQNNIQIIRDERNVLYPISSYQIKNEESSVKILNRNTSEINKAIKNNNLSKVEKIGKYINGVIGLLNIGNTCNFNSAIQNLKNVFPLTLYLLQKNTFNKDGFTFKYCELIANLINQDTYQWYDPKNFLYKQIEMAPTFSFGKQNDSNFCILYILTLLEKETRNYIGEKPFKKILITNDIFSEEEIGSFNIFMDKFYEKRNSCIIDIFYGFQEDIYKCAYCSYATYNYQGFSVLNIPIMRKNSIPIHSLNEGINYYQEIQNHYNENGFICQKCKGNNISTQSRIISCPKYFIINFKRIGENCFYNHNVQIPSNFGVNNLVNGVFYEYILTGFIKHYGGGSSGHNIAICNNFFDSFWYEYDDSRVTFINNSSNLKDNKIDTSGSFLFVYRRSDCSINDNDKKLIKNLSERLRK